MSRTAFVRKRLDRAARLRRERQQERQERQLLRPNPLILQVTEAFAVELGVVDGKVFVKRTTTKVVCGDETESDDEPVNGSSG